MINWSDWVQAGGVLVGLVVLLYELQSLRSANFVTTWANLVGPLQEEDVRSGRWLLRRLRRDKVDPRKPGQWKAPFEWKGPPAQMLDYAKAAYDAFDLAGIMVLHSRIPGLARAFIAEYEDSIIACWEQGVCFFEERVLELQPQGEDASHKFARSELFCCFSLLYVMALPRRKTRTKRYPFHSMAEKLSLWRPSSIWERKARRQREVLISEVIKKRNVQ
jgi:hypothetical protein